MDHLTTREIFHLVDGTIQNGERTALTAHLEQCEQCREEIELQRALTREVRSIPLTNPSQQFTRRVMTGIIPVNHPAWTRKIVDNLGNNLAMMLVLSVLGYAVSSPALWQKQKTERSSTFDGMMKTYSGYYDQAKSYFKEQSTDLIGRNIRPSSSERSEEISIMVIISLLTLAALDKFILQRVRRTRS